MRIPWRSKRPSGMHLLSALLLLAPFTTAVVLDDLGGLDIDITRTGDCTHRSHNGDTLQIFYKLRLKDKEDVIETTFGGEPFEFTLGAGRVIKGWEIGLEEMCLGEMRRLELPPDLAYGARGAPPTIPGGATLVFDLELFGINDVTEPSGSASASPTSPEPGFAIATAPPEPTPTASSTVLPTPDPADALADAIQTPDLPVTDIPPVESTIPTIADDDESEEDSGECKLLGPFSIFIQGALGALALLSLVYKRWRETPRRPLKIWFFDVSKQVFGSVMLHVLNILMSMLSSGKFDVAKVVKPGTSRFMVRADAFVQDDTAAKNQPNPCSFYLLNLAIDTTIGIAILVLLLRILHALFSYTAFANPPESLRSGNYGSPPKTLWWLKQSFIYFIGLFFMKLCVYAIIQMCPWLAWVGDWALRWTEGSEALQIAFTMLIFPLIMNVFQYWIIDSFIKDPAGGSGGAWDGHEQVPQEDDEDERRRLQGSGEHEEDDDHADEAEEVDDAAAKNMRESLKEANPTPVPQYETDGHGSSGSSRGASRGGLKEEAKD